MILIITVKVLFLRDSMGYTCRNFRRSMLKLDIISVMDLSSNNEKKASKIPS